MAFAHRSVLVDEVLAALSPQPGEVICDGTLGGGGHSEALLAAEPTLRIIAIDRDPAALLAAKARLAPFGDRVTYIHGRFGDIASLLHDPVDGFLLDVGVSSPQLDHAERGFSFQHTGPIDMRMDPTTGRTALALLQEESAAEIARILRDYGEERFARRLGEVLSQAARAGTLTNTTDLAALIARTIPAASQRGQRIHPATRSFQALRIAVNGELDELEAFVAAFPHLLRAGGRCAIISFHSLEDRLVKHAFRDLAWSSSLPPQYAAQAGERVHAVCEPLTKKAVFATDAESDANPRARSARLRACLRTPFPVEPMKR